MIYDDKIQLLLVIKLWALDQPTDFFVFLLPKCISQFLFCLIVFFIFSVTEDLLARVAALELSGGAPKAAAPAAAPSKKVEKVEEEDDDEEVDLFGSDSDSEDDAEKARVREERLAAYHAKKAKKPALIAKTSVVLDIKPWDDETDMDAMLKNVKTIVKEGLLWGACKFLFIYLMH